MRASGFVGARMPALIMIGMLATTVVPAQAQQARGGVVPVRSNIQRPARIPFSNTTVSRLRAPAGFEITAFATGLGTPRMMAVGDDGTVYVTRGDSGDVVALRDSDGDGRADQRRVYWSGLQGAHGIALHADRMYVATVAQVHVAEMSASGPRAPRVFQDGLPNGGQHSRRTIAFGPDGMLYISVGSTCNDCPEVNPENAALLRTSPDRGAARTVFARGLRNTLGWGWHPATRELWGWDHGSDFRGDNIPPEELNRIREGAHYGWPFCYGNRVVDRWSHYDPPNKESPASYCARTEPSVLEYTAHSAPIGMVFYTGTQFPEVYRNDAFVAMHGSWNRTPVAPAKVLRIRSRDGVPVAVEDFVTGFLVDNGRTLIGRPAGLAVAADGSLLISDDANGAIYRVAHTWTQTRPGVVCTMEARPALQVTVADARGAPLPASANVRVIVRDGAYADTGRVVPGQTGAASFGLAHERPGTYTLSVRAAGYIAENVAPVRVVKTADGCHVATQRVTVRAFR